MVEKSVKKKEKNAFLLSPRQQWHLRGFAEEEYNGISNVLGNVMEQFFPQCANKSTSPFT
jgi:hypothetical protein